MKIKQSLNTFGLTDAATIKQLQIAYRKGVKQWHPDRFHQETEQRRSEAEEKMRELNLAFEHLSEHHKKHGHFKDVFKKPVIHTPRPRPRPTPSYNAKPEPKEVEEDIVIQTRKTGQNSIWLGLALCVLVGYFLFYGFIQEDISKAKVDVNSVSEINLLSKEEIVSDASQGAAEGAPKAKNETDTTEILERLNNLETNKEEKSAFETRSVFVKEKSFDHGGPYFTFGDTIGTVYEIQGIPTRTDGDIWYYGSSEVHFKNGRVAAWKNTGRPMLKVKY